MPTAEVACGEALIEVVLGPVVLGSGAGPRWHREKWASGCATRSNPSTARRASHGHGLFVITLRSAYERDGRSVAMI
jgi:hypothetical protein